MSSPNEALEAALNELRARRERLDRSIEVLEAELGIAKVATADAKSSVTAPTVRPNSGDANDVLKKIYEGQFFGRSQTQAAKELLNIAKRPMKTPLLSEALNKSGMKAVTTSLYTAFKRSPDFVLVLPNTWGLKEWYSEGVKSITPEKKTKRRERRKKSIKPVTEAENTGQQPRKRGRPRKIAEGVP